MTRACCAVAAALAIAASGTRSSAAAKFVLEVVDAPGVGLNDTRPAAPVGGNAGTTVGEQRKIAVQFAADQWGKVLDSAVPIVVHLSFAPLMCTPSFVEEGHAGPAGAEANLPGFTPLPGLPQGVWFPEALADAIAGIDIRPGEPDIEAEFNGDLGGCFGGGFDWYYGLDGRAGDQQSDLVEIVMHELAHGLGFLSLVDAATGEPFGSPNYPASDAYTAHVFDANTQQHWPQMTNGGRVVSARNVRGLVWDGPAVAVAARKALARGAPLITMTPPVPGFVGFLSEANMGPLLSAGMIASTLVPALAAPDCTVVGSFFGKIALVRGPPPCALVAAYDAEMLGAIGTIYTDEPARTPPLSIEVPASVLARGNLARPVVGLSSKEGDLLRAAPASSALLSADAARFVGADEMGRPYLYASNPIAEGSSISHWDPLARPNLLQEPFTSPIVTHAYAMETALLRDLGWPILCGNGTLDPNEECDDGAGNDDAAPDACRSTCLRARCGDGALDSGEACDEGDRNSNAAPDACRSTCVKATCGDGVVDMSESCDDGAPGGSGTCTSTCTLVGSTGDSFAPANSSSGCNCRLAPAPRSNAAWIPLAIGALSILVRRRARRHP